MKHSIFESSDSNVKKFVFEKEGEIAVEAVLYKYPSYDVRTVICCSTQCGCPVACRFCGTGKFFVRSLSSGEIIEQVETVLSTIDCNPLDIEKLQIMFMSMGEPILNIYNLNKAIEFLHTKYPNASLLVSTSAPDVTREKYEALMSIAEKIDKVGLQFSVHESDDESRHKLIPTKTLSLKSIGELGEEFAKRTGRQPFFNYCVHDQNDSLEDVEKLKAVLNPDIWQCTLSVICESDENVQSSIDRQLDIIEKFAAKMTDAGYSIRVFNPAGQDDIGGGCGQLWYFKKWINENKHKIK
ncbi:MAG: radical SAM protein [Bacteroidales bacterium]